MRGESPRFLFSTIDYCSLRTKSIAIEISTTMNVHDTYNYSWCMRVMRLTLSPDIPNAIPLTLPPLSFRNNDLNTVSIGREKELGLPSLLPFQSSVIESPNNTTSRASSPSPLELILANNARFMSKARFQRSPLVLGFSGSDRAHSQDRAFPLLHIRSGIMCATGCGTNFWVGVEISLVFVVILVIKTTADTTKTRMKKKVLQYFINLTWFFVRDDERIESLWSSLISFGRFRCNNCTFRCIFSYMSLERCVYR